MTATSAKVDEVVAAARRHGHKDIIVLSGVPATGKTHISELAALAVAGHPGFVRRTQFHPGYTYDDFMEGFRPRESGGFEVRQGAFLAWNKQSHRDQANKYVLLIEELSRADLPSVLGEVMTFIEHRGATFHLPISQTPASVSPRLIVLATMNPRDRSALEIDDALIRRLRIIDCPPDMDQLREILDRSLQLPAPRKDFVMSRAVAVFDACERDFPDLYEAEMPFGHGIFAEVRTEQDLLDLWRQRIKHMLFRPQGLAHPFADTIRESYPWTALPTAIVPVPGLRRRAGSGSALPAADELSVMAPVTAPGHRDQIDLQWSTAPVEASTSEPTAAADPSAQIDAAEGSPSESEAP